VVKKERKRRKTRKRATTRSYRGLGAGAESTRHAGDEIRACSGEWSEVSVLQFIPLCP
jgi:hypothetical protein